MKLLLTETSKIVQCSCLLGSSIKFSAINNYIFSCHVLKKFVHLKNATFLVKRYLVLGIRTNKSYLKNV